VTALINRWDDHIDGRVTPIGTALTVVKYHDVARSEQARLDPGRIVLSEQSLIARAARSVYLRIAPAVQNVTTPAAASS
jgi:hypothetical protein